MTSVQCPNCTFYKVTTREYTIDTDTGRETQGCGCSVAVFLAGLFMVVFGAIALFTGWVRSSSLWMIALGVGVLVVWAFVVRRSVEPQHLRTRYAHTCTVCGYEWQQWAGAPPPAVRTPTAEQVAAYAEAERKQRAAEEEHQRNMLLSYKQLYGGDE